MPRDPDRIPVILRKLEKVWRKVPDQRLGQLIGNAAGTDNFRLIEDDEMLASLEKLSAQWD